MALYTAVVGAPTGPVCTGVPVSSSDTINATDVQNGAVLIVTAAGTPTTVTIVDPGHTPAGSTAAASAGVTVAANTSRAFGHLANFADTSGLINVNYSSTTGITAMLVR